MSDPRRDEENPYASPISDTKFARGEPRGDPDSIVIDTWLPPRNAVDFLAGLVALLYFFWPLVVGGGISGFFAYGRVGTLGGAGFMVLLGLSAWLMDATVLSGLNAPLPFVGVTHLSIHAAGIDFHRPTSRPKSVSWEQLRSIRPARPREVFILGWMLFPLGRELTGTRSIHGHYRIEWAGNYSFFPPRDPGLFREAIHRFQPRLLVENES
jgi:hypothetical protein